MLSMYLFDENAQREGNDFKKVRHEPVPDLFPHAAKGQGCTL